MDLIINHTNAHIFKKILDIIYEYPITSCNIKVTETGLYLETMCSSHISVIIVNLHKGFFKYYKYEKTEILGINLLIITTLLKALGKTDNIRLYANGIDNYLGMDIYNDNLKKIYSIPLFSLVTDSLDIPNINYTKIYRLDGKLFYDILQDVSLVKTNDVGIAMGNKQFNFNGEGEFGKTLISLNSGIENTTELNKCKFIIERDDNSIVNNNYSLQLIKNISKAKDISNMDIIISSINNFPLSIKYNIDEYSYLQLYVSPRIID